MTSPAHTHDDVDRLTIACPGCVERVRQDQAEAAFEELLDAGATETDLERLVFRGWATDQERRIAELAEEYLGELKIRRQAAIDAEEAAPATTKAAVIAALGRTS
jgi:hypothetical protein